LAFTVRRDGAQLRDYHDDTKRDVRGAPQPNTVILNPNKWPVWLGEEPADPHQLKELLAPYPSEEMMCWPVSARVGNVKNNDPSLIEAVAVAG
jgi:putative SOS response-associated peptidase YedK